MHFVFSKEKAKPIDESYQYVLTGTEGIKGEQEILPFVLYALENSWTVFPNVKPYLQKCLDLPSKGIISVSPFVFAAKKKSFPGGKKYRADKTKIFDRVPAYLRNCSAFYQNEDYPELREFHEFLQDEERIMVFLEGFEGQYEQLGEEEYVTFTFFQPRNVYKEYYQRYLEDKVFNGKPIERGGEKVGVSNFHNGFNKDKPFLTHLTSTFSVGGYISLDQALDLFWIDKLLLSTYVPSPLPLFVSEEEAQALQQELADIAPLRLLEGDRPSHRSIMEKLLHRRQAKGLGNYYLLYHQRGEILDFDFVPKFEYEMKDPHSGGGWSIHPIFTKDEGLLVVKNVFEFQDRVLPIIFNNKLVVQRKDKPPLYNWFGELPRGVPPWLQSLVLTYRKSFYDFVYKSRRSAISYRAFHQLMKSVIVAEIGADKIERGYHTHDHNIREKLNIWFSLYYAFSQSPQHTEDMVNHTESLRAFTASLVEKGSEATISTTEQFAFLSGQLVRYLLMKVSSDKQPHGRLERFLRARGGNQLKVELVKLFERYKHENFSGRFERCMAQVMAVQVDDLNDDFIPFLLAGYFSPNQLKASRETNKDQ